MSLIRLETLAVEKFHILVVPGAGDADAIGVRILHDQGSDALWNFKIAKIWVIQDSVQRTPLSIREFALKDLTICILTMMPAGFLRVEAMIAKHQRAVLVS